MREFYQKLNLQLNKEAVLARMEGDKSEELEKQVGERYDTLLPVFLAVIFPQIRLEIEKEEGYAYVLLTLGSEVCEKIQAEMKRGNVMDSLLLDAMADSYLFQMDHSLPEITKETFADLKLGISKRLEPGVDIPLEQQQTIFEKVKCSKDFLSITKGYMFEPVKTFGYILKLTEDEKVFAMQHDCSKCSNLKCKMRGRVAMELKNKDSFMVITAGTTIKQQELREPPYQVAVDLGTTTIAMQLLSGAKAVPVATYTAVNSCRRFGADVITRIENANQGGLEKLTALSRSDILQGIQSLCSETGLSLKDISRIGVAGNTTVSQIFLGLPLTGLAGYPFTPAYEGFAVRKFGELFLGFPEAEAEVLVFPPISGFVGGDIVAGLYQCGYFHKIRPAMLIDLGTNGEMALGTGEKILVTSVAAGPAFEGGGLVHGVGSIGGAISGFELSGGQSKVTTIHQESPIGICGTGMVEILSECRDRRILNEKGNFVSPYDEEGFTVARDKEGKSISVYQQDVRELQLAKGAIGAGIELLAKAYEKTYRQIPEVYVAGGFGYRINIRKAVNIGIFPREFLGKIKAVGNTSLAGVESFLRDDTAREKILSLVENSKEVVLANHQDFQETYLKHMDL